MSTCEEASHLKSLVRDYDVNLFKEENYNRDPIISWTTYPTIVENHQTI